MGPPKTQTNIFYYSLPEGGFDKCQTFFFEGFPLAIIKVKQGQKVL